MGTVTTTTVPRHVGLILDGNRRWAAEHGVSAAEGHKAGYENLKRIADSAFEQGVEYVSAYVFSTENWSRGKDEVRNLMKMMLWVLKHEVGNLSRRGIRIRTLGTKLRLGTVLLRAIHDAEEQTKGNTRGTILLCLDYGGQQEVVEAIKAISEQGIQPADITAETITKHLYAADVPAPDLIIRTSGEQRLSNFMLWRSAYSELMFTRRNWPDFSEADLKRMLRAYARRQRRYGT
jgi:undecaprenyl diphosphate synthase